MNAPDAGVRIDKWLWRARFFRTRALSSQVVASGKVRLNARRIRKPSAIVRIGDGLAFPQAGDIRVIRIVDLGDRRGPAVEARALYEDLDLDRPANEAP